MASVFSFGLTTNLALIVVLLLCVSLLWGLSSFHPLLILKSCPSPSRLAVPILRSLCWCWWWLVRGPVLKRRRWCWSWYGDQSSKGGAGVGPGDGWYGDQP